MSDLTETLPPLIAAFIYADLEFHRVMARREHAGETQRAVEKAKLDIADAVLVGYLESFDIAVAEAVEAHNFELAGELNGVRRRIAGLPTGPG